MTATARRLAVVLASGLLRRIGAPLERYGWALGRLAVSSLLLVASSRPAAAACKSTCTEELRVCRRACATSHGHERRQCLKHCGERSTCTAPGAAIRTAAYVVTECRSDRGDSEGRSSFAQKLVVRRGNCDPVTIKEFRQDPVPDPVTLCRLFGSFRVGTLAVEAGLFQRIGVLPDGSGVVFEVTDEFSVDPSLTPDLSDTERGIFFVHADGSGLRRLGDATHAPTFTSGSINETVFAVSPDQTTVAFSDVGPGADGLAALQIFTMALESGERRALTRLTAREPGDTPAVGFPSFIDDRTIVFEVHADPSNPDAGQASYSVRIDGSDLHALRSLIPIPGAKVVPRFDVTRGGTHVAHVSLLGEPLDPSVIVPGRIREIFLFDHQNALQLTKLRQFDTHLPVLARERVYFISSADPLHENRGRICQIFSIDLLASHLRQLTHFKNDEGLPSPGCTYARANACTNTSGVQVDPVSGTVVFSASCDPFGTNPYGDQLYAMRPDGSGLRQLTALRGMQTFPDGSALVELPGPASYSAPVP